MTPAAAEPAPGPALSPEEFNAAVAAVTNAFGDPTRREIYLYVREHPGTTAGFVAEQFGVHANVARHHLEKLTAGGYLRVETARAEGRAGRPSKRYRVVDADAGLSLPAGRDDILAGLLARALDLLGPEQAEAMADEVGYEYGRALAERIEPGEGHRSARAAIAAVADALTAHGFAAHTEPRENSLAIVAECCPFGDAATRYPHVVCAVDRGIIRGMLAGLYGETQPRFEERRPDGDTHCVARV